jgi:ribosome-binding protein aMBF1 (putative translation factor)
LHGGKNMKKTIAKKNNFVPLSEILTEKLKDARFKKLYSEEFSRLQLAHDIRSLRQKRGMTQEQVAEKAKMPQSVVARLESGSRGFSIGTLHKIAKVFDREIGLVAPRR